MEKKQKRPRFFVIAGLVLAAFAVLAALISFGNNALTVSRLTVSSKKLPSAFDGMRLVQISDLHNTRFGTGQKHLLKQVQAQKPDAILLTGDLIDRRRYHPEVALEFVRGAVKIAPVYLVDGNHEVACGHEQELLASLEEAGVVILNDKRVLLEKDGAQIALAGLRLPVFGGSEDETDADRLLQSWTQTGHFTILLSHYPELLDGYAASGVDLVFSGHAHGGQIRLPGIGGVFAPGQGFWPQYTDGLYQKQNTQLVVSRGLGNSGFPVRVFNRPQIICVTLQAEK